VSGPKRKYRLTREQEGLASLDNAKWRVVHENLCVIFGLPNLPVGDFSKRDNYLTVVRIDQRFRTFKQLPCPLRRKHYELKTVVNFLQAIFNSDSGHRLLLVMIELYSNKFRAASQLDIPPRPPVIGAQVKRDLLTGNACGKAWRNRA